MLIELEHVTKSYKDFHLDCSLCLKEGMITGLVGQNGAGKSTTFKIILGLESAEGGRLRVLGKKPEEREAADKAKIGAVLSESGFGGHVTVKQAASILSAAYEQMDPEAFLSACSRWGLPLDKKTKEFSTGMKAKLKVLVAMSHKAPLLILDEPATGLDVIARDEILDMLREYMDREGQGILISSHISGDLESLCDDIYMIHDGAILFHEETDVILSDYGILKVREEEYESLEKEPIMCVKKESYGYCCLTCQRRFYEENYPNMAVEKCGIDQIETMLIKGEQR